MFWTRQGFLGRTCTETFQKRKERTIIVYPLLQLLNFGRVDWLRRTHPNLSLDVLHDMRRGLVYGYGWITWLESEHRAMIKDFLAIVGYAPSLF